MINKMEGGNTPGKKFRKAGNLLRKQFLQGGKELICR